MGGWASASGWRSRCLRSSRLVGSNSVMLGLTLHVGLGVIGASFGMLFQRDVRGSGRAWAGEDYGISGGFGTAHASCPSCGAPARLVYQRRRVFGRWWARDTAAMGSVTPDDRLGGFFHDSDPINREVEGPGTRTLRSLGWGAAASLTGGLLFSLVMVATGVLPQIANLVGSSSPVLGFVVHMGISTLIGMSYGVLFAHEAPDFGSAHSLGLTYGLAWWFVAT